MTATAQQIQIAAKLYEARDAMRSLLGERYAARMAEIGGVLKKVAAHDSVNEIQAAQVVIAAIDAQGFDALQLLAAAVELVEPSATFWHGGRPGLKPGTYLLPPVVTKATSLADCGADGVCRRDRVYITTERAAALLYASGIPGGVIYECEPVGAVEPDPDCNVPGLSFQVEKARIVRCIKPSQHDIEAARTVLMGGSA